MEAYLAYIRVSTQKQGETGSSLAEQRDAITAFAGRNGLAISRWFEETETAAKQGRGKFTAMMRILCSRKAHGVVFHKIDRGARNLKDWNAIQELIDLGLDVRFAHESLDMQTRGGRLTADLLAVIASDYIRNLREEVRKGIRGRLKQGLYPLQAPLGYLDAGGGKPKTHDAIRAPLIRQAFELYATGQFGIHALVDEMYRRGLRTRAGGKVGISNMAAILRRTFYMGLIKMRGAVYQGIHKPIVPVTVFKRVQDVLDGKLSARPQKHDFLFRKLVNCTNCEHSLIGERQKGHAYYRCHSRTCAGTSVREETVEESLLAAFRKAQLSEGEIAALTAEAKKLGANWDMALKQRQQAKILAEQNIATRLSRLTDALLDELIDKELFETKKAAILAERLHARETRGDLNSDELVSRVLNFLELAKTLSSSYETAETSEKRQFLKITTSNLWVSGKTPGFKLRSPYFELANREPFQFSALTLDRPRTGRLPRKLKKLLNVIVNNIATPEELGDGVKYFQ